MRNITYANVSDDPFTAARTVRFVLTDGDGGTSTAATKTINVAAVVDHVLAVDTTSDTADGTTTSIDALLANKGADGKISLREAILAANNTANGGTPDVINFDIAGAGPHTIVVASALPDITDSVIIDGNTEPDFGSTPIIELDGSVTVAGEDGLRLAAGSDGSTIRGLVINRFDGQGINIVGSDGNTIEGNFIGTDVSGTLDLGNTDKGIRIASGADNNIIGGTTAAARNVISGNDGDGIRITVGSSNNQVLGNFIGTDVTGTVALGNTGYGILINSTATSNTVGGTAAGAGNVISANLTKGIGISGIGVDNNVVQGNYVGTDLSGTVDLGNTGTGIWIANSATGNTIGGTASGAGNVVAFNDAHGIDILDTAGATNTLLGNLVRSNSGLGIDLNNDDIATANDAEDADSGPNDLLNFPVLTNVVQNGANLDIDFAIDLPAGNYRIEFFDNANGLDASGFGEGQTFIGFANITATGAAGYEIFSTTLTSVTVSDILNITTTATAADGTFSTFGGTSEFGPPFQGAGVLTVTTTSDTSDGDTSSIVALLGNRGADGRISLREAITAANNTSNLDTFTPDQIHFNIAGTGPHTIAVTSALPDITDAVTIDATTDDSFAANGNRPAIVLDGNNSFAGDGLVLTSTADGSTIRGFVIRDFSGDGIEIQAGSNNNIIVDNYIGRLTTSGTDAGATEVNTGQGLNILGANNTIDGNVISGNWAGVYISGGGASGNVVTNNLIGTDATGTVLIGNNSNGVDIGSGAPYNTVGGIGLGNLIVGSANDGITIWGAGATGNTVQGNTIGTDATGTLDWGNSNNGVIVSGDAVGNLVGGVNAGEGNVIAFNHADGVVVDDAFTNSAAIVGNSIYSNTGLGIDLGTSGVTTNDVGDGDAGANSLQNFPVLTSASTSGSQVTIKGTLNSTANSYFRIEFFANTSGDGSGYGEGQRYLGFANVATNGSGNVTINTTLTASVAVGEFVSATSTKSNAGFTTFTDSSEFAQNVAVVAASSPGTAIWRNSGDSTPDANNWDGVNFLGAGNSASLGQLRIVEAAEAPTRDEKIVVGVDTSGWLRGEMWNGTAWTVLPFSLPPSLNSNSQNFDVAYESSSGNAVLVWDNLSGGTASVSYRVWDGTSWSAEATITAPNAGIATALRLSRQPAQ